MRRLPLLAALPLIVGFGVAEGIWSNRWQPSRESQEAAARLKAVPLSVGDWQAEAQDMDAREQTKAEINGYLMRRYVQRSTGNSLQVLIVCGPPGPVSVHTPDICFAGAGYRMDGGQTAETVKAGAAGSAALWSARFARTDAAIPERLRIRWTWTTDGTWQAPENPRPHFARARVLYKLYVIEQVEGAEVPVDQDQVGTRFLEAFLPQLQQTLFSNAEAGQS